MFQTRIHGRGGQGVVTAAELLSVAAFIDGLHAQAFPSFGSERTGAPVVSFTRFDDKPIRLREPIDEPDALIVQDPTLLAANLFAGVSHDAYVIINSGKPWDALAVHDGVAARDPKRHFTVPATDYAMEFIGKPLPNAALLGAFAAATGQVKLESVLRAIAERFPSAVATANQKAARAAYDHVSALLQEVANA